MVYEPREDTYLMLSYIESLQKTKNIQFLEMGCGNGVVSQKALEKNWEVTAADSNPEAVQHCRNKLDNQSQVIRSDLYRNIDKEFNIAVFNPPYLPCENGSTSDTSSKNGVSTLKQFLNQTPKYLKKNGRCIVIDSSRNSWKPPEDHIERSLKLWFERLRIVDMPLQFLTQQEYTF